MIKIDDIVEQEESLKKYLMNEIILISPGTEWKGIELNWIELNGMNTKACISSNERVQDLIVRSDFEITDVL